MITHINGSLEELEPTFAVIDCKGIGYFIKITLPTYEFLRGKKEAMLYTHYQVKEDAHILYGFSTKEERLLFEQLLSVSGVGGNTALTLLSGLPVSEIQMAIASGDENTFKKIKGVGVKTAGRIILELKGKLPKGAEPLSRLEPISPKAILREEALAALATLGLDRKMMEKRIDEILAQNEINSLETLIKAALRN
jgi:Holliday junction DNA helicase RuvA